MVPPPTAIQWIVFSLIMVTGSIMGFGSSALAVNVQDFGARGDAVTDDTGAIIAALASSSHVHFPSGVYIITDGIELPRGARLTGEGAPLLGTFPLSDDKDFFADGQLAELPGTTILFRGKANRSITCPRKDRFASMRFALRTHADSSFQIESLAIALDMVVRDRAGRRTTPQNDQRSDCDVGLLVDDSAAGTVRDVRVFGYWNKAGLAVVSRGIGDNPDYNTFWNSSFMGDVGVALIGTDESEGPGLSGTQFHGCRLFAADHHSRSAGQFGTAALFIDGCTSAKRADLNGHAFFGGCIRTYNNTAVRLDHVSNLSFHGTVFEVPAYDGPEGKSADKTGRILGTKNTRQISLFGCRMHDIGLNELGKQMIHSAVIAIPDRFGALSVNRSGDTVRISGSASGPYVQLTQQGDTTNSGEKIRLPETARIK